MSDQTDNLVTALFSEIIIADQLARARLTKALPKGMEISHFAVLNHLAGLQTERSPAQLAQAFNLTRGAMTNTLHKLEDAGYIHIRPDWDDARRKLVGISPAGMVARDTALAAITPIMREVADSIGVDRVKLVLPVLREIRQRLTRTDN